MMDEALETVQAKLATLEPHIVSGEWGPWSDWSSCNRTCPPVMKRKRACNNPAPECGGSFCQGEEGGGEDEIYLNDLIGV